MEAGPRGLRCTKMRRGSGISLRICEFVWGGTSEERDDGLRSRGNRWTKSGR
jgi:hypothetical protein